MGIITNVTEMQNETIKRPNTTTTDDYDVYAAICQTAKQCNPIQTSFQHVKGHQDKTPNRPLTNVEQLNVTATAEQSDLPNQFNNRAWHTAIL